jgi:hypothetical protein
MVGSTPLPKMRSPSGVSQRSTARRMADPSGRPKFNSTVPVPKVVSPTSSARPADLMAADKISAEDAVPWSIRTTNGASVAGIWSFVWTGMRCPSASSRM